jgi:hypothetical protein
MYFGTRVYLPRHPSLFDRANVLQKLTSGLVGRTERSLAQKAGHLELLAGGKKDKGGQKK